MKQTTEKYNKKKYYENKIQNKNENVINYCLSYKLKYYVLLYCKTEIRCH